MNDLTLAFNLYKQAVLLVGEQRKLFLDLGFVLKELKDGNKYKEVGDGGFETWNSFLSSPEISLTPSTADVYIKVYTFYIEKLKMPREEVLAIPLVRLNMMKYKLEGMNEVERGELIEKAKTLSYTDFKIEAIDNGIEIKKAFKISHCEECRKLKIQYDPNQICDCGGGVDITPY